MARGSAAVRLFHLALLGVLLFYLTLPYWGTAWHSVVPEHEHWGLGAGAHDTFAAAEWCALCTDAPMGETVIHAFSPVSAMQFLSLVFGLAVVLLLHVPDGFPARLYPEALFLQSPPLVPLDPPPMS